MNALQTAMRASSWANSNLWVSRIAIIISHISLIALAILIGTLFSQLGFHFSSYSIWIAIFLVAFCFSTYPVKKSVSLFMGKHLYAQRKLIDFTVALLSFLILIVLSNIFHKTSYQFHDFMIENSLSASIYIPKINKDSTTHSLINPLLKRKMGNRYINKNYLKLKEFTKRNSIDPSDDAKREKIVYTILAVIGAAVLLSVVAVLACSLSCSGANGAALLVGIFGVGGIVFLFILLMRHLYKKKQAT